MFWNRWIRKEWECRKCGGSNQSDSEFCVFCGLARHSSPAIESAPREPRPAPATVNCPACGAVCRKDAPFCSHCGASVRKSAPPSVPRQEIVPEPPKAEPSVRCVHCGTMNAAHERFCSHCSEEIRIAKENAAGQETHRSVSAAVCPECGARNDNETVFCLECGTRMSIGR